MRTAGRRREEDKKPAPVRVPPPVLPPAAQAPSPAPELPAFSGSASADEGLEPGELPLDAEALDLRDVAETPAEEPAAAAETPVAEPSAQTLSAHDELALDEWEVTGDLPVSLPPAAVVSADPRNPEPPRCWNMPCW